MSRAKSLAWIGGVGLLGLTPAALFAQGLPLPPAPDNTVPVQVAPPQAGAADVVQTGGGGERTLRPRDILKDGVENHRKAEFELADVYLKKAQELRGSLSASEQKELDAYLSSNNKALTMRKQGVETIKKTSEAINAGKYSEAAAGLTQLKSNPYLSAQDRQSVVVLTDALAKNNAATGGATSGAGNVASMQPTVTPKGKTPADMVAAAREAYKKGNLDEAQMWAMTAKQQGVTSKWPWEDNVDKVLADVNAARKKQGTAVAGNSNVPADQRQMQAKQLCMQASQALAQGDVATAKKLTQQAKDLKVNLAWFEDYTPEKMDQAIARAEKGGVPSGAKMVVNTPADPRVAVKEAQAALEQGNLDRAEELCVSARAAKVHWGYFETTPDKVLVDVRKARETVNGKKAAELLVTARKNLDAGNLDEAEKCCAQSKALKSEYPMWDLTSDRPDKLMAEITAKKAVAKRNQPLQPLNDVNNRTVASSVPAKTQTPVSAPTQNQQPVPPAATVTTAANGNLVPPSAPQANTVPATTQSDPRVTQANRLMAEARMDLNKGQYESALSKAATVKQMGVQTADNPDSILAAVKAVQATRDAKTNPAVADAKRTKALQLMASAKVMMKTGDIMGAHKAVTEAKGMNVVFQQGDELPEAMLSQLQVKAREQVDTYAKAADTLTQRGRTGEAQQYRNYVMNLAMTFNVPAPQMSSTGAPSQLKVDVAVTDVATQGKKLCMDIEQCMREGQLVQARKLANALYEGPYGMKPQAGQFLAQLDAADMKATIKVSEQYYDLVVKAVNRKEYDLAKTYAEKIDRKLLDAAKTKHLNELMSSPVFQAEKDKPVIQMADNKVPQDGKAGQSPLLDEVRKKQEIESQRLSEMQKLAQAKSIKLAQSGNLEGAIAELKGALELVKKADSDVPKVAEMARQLEMRVKRLEQANEEATFAKEAKEKLDAKSNAVSRKRADEENRRNQVAALMTECKNLMKEGKYAEAEARAERAHAIDPDNVAIDLARQQARTIKNLTDEEKVDKNNRDLFTGSMNDVVNNKVVGDNKPVDYDPSFNRVGAERMRKLAERVNRDKASENLPSNSRMNSTVSVDFRNKPLGEVVDELRTLSQTNIVLETFALEYAGIDPKMPISVTLNNVSLRTVLDQVLNMSQLTYYVSKGVICITTKEARRGVDHLTKRSFAVHDLIVPRDDMATLPNLNPSAAVPVSTTGDSNGFGAGAGREGYNGMADLKNGQWQTRRTGQTLEKQLMHLITSSIEPSSWKAAGSGGNGTIEYYPMGMTLVVSQSSDIQEQIEELIKRLRELQEVQITVEVRILTLTDDFFERMGVDFNVLLPNRNTAFDRQVASAQFAPAGQLNYPNNVNAIVGLTPNGNFTNNLGIPISNDSYNASRLPTGFAGFGPPGQTGGLDMGVAFLSSIQVFLVMEAVQGDVRNSTLQAPKITMFNGQAASISSTTTEFFVTSVTATPNFFTGIPVFTPNNVPIPTGTTLTVQAVVTNDRRYVQLTLQPVISSVTDRSRAFTAVAGITVQQPAINTITLATTVMVPDGGTILVGGLKTMNEQRREFGPPILSKIPYVNRLFRNQAYGKSATSLMFMVTPRIIINEEEEEKLGNTFTY